MTCLSEVPNQRGDRMVRRTQTTKLGLGGLGVVLGVFKYTTQLPASSLASIRSKRPSPLTSMACLQTMSVLKM